jgi:hypothetical protein
VLFSKKKTRLIYFLITSYTTLFTKYNLNILTTTRFQIDRWLKNVSAKHVWNQFRTCWIDTYLKSSDVIIADSDKQFVSREFKHYADNMKIIVKIVSIETHHSIEMMKRYHESLRRIYSIITIEISEIDLELTLQMTFKIINDSIELNDLISTLLIFEIYFRMIEMNVSSFIIIQRVIVMRKVIKEVRKLNANASDEWRFKYSKRIVHHSYSWLVA